MGWACSGGACWGLAPVHDDTVCRALECCLSCGSLHDAEAAFETPPGSAIACVSVIYRGECERNSFCSWGKSGSLARFVVCHSCVHIGIEFGGRREFWVDCGRRRMGEVCW